MRVTDRTIGMAVLRIFRDYRVFHDGGSLLISDVADAWKETGLRTRDLETGLRWLQANGWATRAGEDSRDATTLRLQAPGAAHLSRFPGRLSEWFHEMEATFTLMQAHRRVHRAAAPA